MLATSSVARRDGHIVLPLSLRHDKRLTGLHYLKLRSYRSRYRTLPPTVSMSNVLNGVNALDPSRLTSAERLDEVARILAAGIRRARNRQTESQERRISNSGEVSLDFTARQRGSDRPKTRRGERK